MGQQVRGRRIGTTQAPVRPAPGVRAQVSWWLVAGSLAAAALLLLPRAGRAQGGAPDGIPAVARDPRPDTGFASVLGLPPRVRAFIGPYAGFGGPAGAGGAIGAGLYKDIFNPALGVLGAQIEGYVGKASRQGGASGSVAIGLRSPSARLGGGLDIDLPSGRATPFVSIMDPIRRGGLLVPGSLLHVSWLFGGAQRFRLGLAVPVGQPLVGHDRPQHDRVDTRPLATKARTATLAALARPVGPVARDATAQALPAGAQSAPPAAGSFVPVTPIAPAAGDLLTGAAATLRAQVARVAELVVPYIGRAETAHAPDQREVADSAAALGDARHVVPEYDATLDRGFSLAVDPRASGSTAAGRALAQEARTILLDDVLLPYDRLLGQKRAPETTGPFAAAARDVFAASLARVPDAGARGRAAWVFDELLAATETVARGELHRWDDARLVWLPLQLALRDDQHESQVQIDSLVQRATGGAFSDSNQVAYARNEQFQWELYRSIQDARRYHVLWVHDFRGLNDQKLPDGVAYRQVAYGYLAALIRNVRAYDSTGVLPEFHIFLDDYYFEMNDSRLWLAMLQDPLDRRIHLHGAPPAWQTTIDSLQDQLRAAVAGSRRLQEDARLHGRDWITDRVCVHVHVTGQPDPSFRSPDIFPVIGLTDNVLRDHRKLAFYDLTEGDPYRGMLIMTGMGVGELYASPEWEDRAVLLRGPAALTAKGEAARELISQGVPAAQLPAFFRPPTKPLPVSARAPVPRFDLTPATVMQLHNEEGYGDKRATVAKAMLYTLMPAGSVLKIPDSLWNNSLWASLLVGQALRGGRVLIMAPSQRSAPSPDRFALSLAEQVLSRVLVASHALAPAIAGTGGLLHVGIYDVEMPVDNVPARIDTALARRARTPWLVQLEPFSREVVDSLQAVSAELKASGFSWPDSTGRYPKLHLKEQFFASAEGWKDLFREPGWGAVLAASFRDRARLVQQQPQYLEFYRISAPAAPADGTPATSGALFRQQVSASKPDGPVYYLLLGSHNEDFRSALLDGESVLLLAHYGAAVGIDDAVLLPSLCTWVDTPGELHRYLPARGARVRQIARWSRILY